MSNRRAWLMAGAGAAALGLGLTVGWRKAGQSTAAAPGAGAGSPASSGDGGQSAGTGDAPSGIAALWPQRFARPEGGELVVAELRGRPLIVNFWATWCAPCVREMPLLESFYQSHRAAGWQVLGLAIDGPTPVRDFLKRVPISFPIGLAGVDGTVLVRALGNTQGGLPYSVLVSAAGAPLDSHMGELTADMLKGWRTQA